MAILRQAHRHAGIFGDGRRQIDVGDDLRLDAVAGRAGIAHQQRHFATFLIGTELAGDAVRPPREAVVGSEDDQRVVQHPLGLQGIDDLADAVIDGQQGALRLDTLVQPVGARCGAEQGLAAHRPRLVGDVRLVVVRPVLVGRGEDRGRSIAHCRSSVGVRVLVADEQEERPIRPLDETDRRGRVLVVVARRLLHGVEVVKPRHRLRGASQHLADASGVVAGGVEPGRQGVRLLQPLALLVAAHAVVVGVLAGEQCSPRGATDAMIDDRVAEVDP